MLQYETAKAIFEKMKEKTSNSKFDGLFKLFLKTAVEYGSTRSAWACMDQAARNEDDKSRTVKHDAFISILNAVSRNLDMDIEDVMPDRKTKGDFACYITLFLALEER